MRKLSIDELNIISNLCSISNGNFYILLQISDFNQFTNDRYDDFQLYYRLLLWGERIKDRGMIYFRFKISKNRYGAYTEIININESIKYIEKYLILKAYW